MRRDRRSERPGWSLVGRDGIVELLDRLVRWSGVPVPIVVVYGPGGIGKSALLKSVFNRYRLDAPVVRVNLDDGPPKALYAVLDDACERLTSQRFGVFGRVTMPRYALIRDIQRGYPRMHTGGDRRRLARSLLAGHSEVLAAAAEVSVGVVGKVLPPLADEVVGATPQGALRGLLGRARPMPVLRWVLGGIGYARVLRWFERTAAGRLPDLVDGDGVDLVQACWRHMDANCSEAAAECRDRRTEEEPRDDQALTATMVDRLAVEAFLEDLARQYPRRRRLRRRVNCVLLLDGADLLSPEDGRLISSDRNRRMPTRGDDVLELFAQAKQHVPDAPLLIVATKQAALPSTEHARACRLDDEIDNGVDTARVAGEVLKTWRRRWAATHAAHPRRAVEVPESGDDPVDSAYLHVRLRPLTPPQTARLLAMWNTDPSEAQLWELHQVTHGHPLALRLIIEALKERARQQGARRWPVIRTLLDTSPVGRPDATGSETIADYLLFKTFFQRFPDDPISCDGAGKTDRVRTRKVVANLAAARTLDRSTLRLLAPDRVHDKMWADLISYSFIQPTATGQTLSLDPLLRDLLIRRRALTGPDSAPSESEPADFEFSHTEVHQRLRDYFSTGDGNHRTDARLEAAYHALALGDPTPASELFARRMDDPHDPNWAADLENLAAAPMSPQSILAGRPDVPAVFAPAAEVLEATQHLLSVTSRGRWSTVAFRRLADLYDAGLERVGPGSSGWSSQVERYRRLEIGAAGTMPVPTAGLARDARRPYRPPHTWRLRPAYVVLTILLLGSSVAAVEGLHLHTACTRDGGWPGELTRPLHRDGLDLTRTADGQCTGVSDRPGAFIPDERTASNDDKDVAALTRLITQENAKVLRASAQGKRYVTVVVATILSTSDRNSAPGRTMSTGANALRGALTAQRVWNQFDGPSEKVLLRLLIANLGGNAAHAESVADQIRRVAQADHTVIAVTGFGHTRVETLLALQRLGPDQSGARPGLPVVASTISGNVFSSRPYFFRVGPSNDRQAQVAVKYINENFGERRPFIMFDESDLYSVDLMFALTRRLSTDGKLSTEPSLKSYRANLDDTAAQLRAAAESICQESTQQNASPLILFTGRANEVPELLADINEQTCGREPIVFGGDALSTLETVRLQDFKYPNQYRRDQLYYTTFGPTGPADYDKVHGRGSAENTDFFGRYRDVQLDVHNGGSSLNSPATSHVMLAYDAVMLIGVRLQMLPGQPTSEQLYNSLREGAPYPGVTGLIDYGSATGAQPNTDPLNKLIVVQHVKGTPGSNGENSLQAELVYSDGML